MSASELITLGIGTPSTIPYFITVGLGIGAAAAVNEPYRVEVAGVDTFGRVSVDAEAGDVRMVDGEARI